MVPAYEDMSLLTKAERWHTKFDTDLWWETGESAEAAGSSLDGCKTNAKTTEEPRSIVMTMNAKDMVHETDGQSIEQLLSELDSRRTKAVVGLVGGGDRSDQTGMLH